MKNNWISVEDRLPDNEKDVLVYTSDGLFDIGFYSFYFKKWICHYDHDILIRDLKVSHWQPLLKPV